MGQDGVSSEHQYLMTRRFASFPLAFPQDRHFLRPRPWQVTTTTGNSRTTHQLEATTAAAAILAGLELGGPHLQPADPWCGP
jgi:hypothetical protein